MYGGLGGVGWVWRDPADPPPLPVLSPHRLLASGQSISPAPSGHRRVQSGVARIVLLIAGAAMPPPPPPPQVSAEEDWPPHPPRTPHKGVRQGRLALLCKLCAGHAMPTCPPPGAVLMVPRPLTQGLGLPCPGLVAPPEMEALTTPPSPPNPPFLELLVRRAWCPASSPTPAAGSLPAPHHLLLGPPTWATIWGAPTGCPLPRPDKGATPRPAVLWGAVGKAWAGTPPPFIYCKGKLSIERYIFLSLF